MTSTVHYASYIEQAPCLLFAQLVLIIAVVDEGEVGELLLRPHDDLELSLPVPPLT